VGPATADAYLRFARAARADDALRSAATVELGEVVVPAAQAGRQPDEAAPYLELELGTLPEIAAPKVKPKQLSTGASPLTIQHGSDGFRLTCTGCGQSSQSVKFRWQVHEQTVTCRCD
jgi:hypothetical protein